MLKLEVVKKGKLWVSSHGVVERPFMPSKFTHNTCFVTIGDLSYNPWSHVENEGSK